MVALASRIAVARGPGRGYTWSDACLTSAPVSDRAARQCGSCPTTRFGSRGAS